MITEVDKKYLKMAFIWAENSYCIRRKVGSLIVKDKMIISDGYNGTPSGFSNTCEYYKNPDGSIEDLETCKPKNIKIENLVTKPFVMHAEANAITKIAKSNNSSNGATIYITDCPCIECSKLIVQSGIKRVVYCRPYSKQDGIDLLKSANITVEQIDYDELYEKK